MLNFSVLTLQATDSELVKAITRLLEVLFGIFGPWGTVGIIFLVALALFGRRVYNDYRGDKLERAALREKDRTIQRQAEEIRTYRIMFFMDKAGWTEEMVEKFVTRNDFEDPVSARKALEGETPKLESPPDTPHPQKEEDK